MKTKHNVSLILSLLCALVFTITTQAQQKTKEQLKQEQEAQDLLNEAQDYLAEDNFPLAEASYRKAIAKNPTNQEAKYNLGNLYYTKDKVSEAGEKYVTAETASEEKELKHKSAHNLGNTFMRDKKYAKAVEAYKQALRNNPNDDETRYNLALAKSLLEKEQKDGGGGNDDKKNEEQNKDKDKQDDQEKKEGDQGEKDKDDKGEESEDGNEGDDKENKENQGNKDESEEGKPKDDKQDDGKNNDGKEKKEQQQPQQGKGQLSPQQIQNLLETMANQEAKVQEKLNAKKAKAAKVKTEKDW